MNSDLTSLHNYIRAVERLLATSVATEHSYRSDLGDLIVNLGDGITAINEPRRIECGAPDLIVTKGATTLGYVEAKDIGKSLDEEEKSEQLKRYRNSLTNLILTDYIEFRWYVDGERRLSARLGYVTKEGKIKRDKDGITDVAELFSSFLAHRAEAVGTPKELALRMARLAHMIRNLIVNAFGKEPESGSLHTQLLAFRDNLIPDLSVEYFADMYAQTIAYGLFAARCTRLTGLSFTRFDAAQNLPKTNPFLRKLFQYIAGYELDDRIAWLVDDLAQVLAQADMEAVLKDFGKRTAKEDPVVHFYETFLTAYDPKVRERRGVYYTPEPVVSYIVCSIDHLLKTRFNKPLGLADEKTLILDPAVGTATFLYMVINTIHQSFAGQEGMWNDYVAEKLLPRIFGFELLMAPYAVAHLKLGLLLQETGYQFQSDKRLGIYMTNTLEEALKHSETLFAQWITEEANAAAEIKKEKSIMVVLGNPPYAVSSVNKGKYIEKLMERYKVTVRSERNIQPLSDDYIKFIRFAHDRIERTGYGVVGMITNHSYLSGLIHRGMREELMKAFDDIYVLNIHGNALIGETTPDGSPDGNVFDIRQGVAISLFVKTQEDGQGLAQVKYADLWGLREDKYRCLWENDVSTTDWHELQPVSPYFFFVPMNLDLLSEYDLGWSVIDIFPKNGSGIKTHRDHFVIDFEQERLRSRIAEFREGDLSDDEAREKFKLEDTRDWKLSEARAKLQARDDWGKNFNHCLYRAFDIRPIYYSGDVIELPRSEVMHHMITERNIALLCKRQSKREPFSYIFSCNQIAESCIFESAYANNSVFPLYLYPAEGEMQFEKGCRPNLNPEFIKTFSEKLGLEFVEYGKGDLKWSYGPEDIFNYAYAVFHSPIYRTRYAEFLKIDFPRLPLTSEKELFKALIVKGAELVSLHLMESPALYNFITKYPVTGSSMVEKVTYDENTQRVYINKTQYFEGVPQEVWNFHIGGYQVCHKWLKDRKGRTLTYDDLTHYQKIVVALKETIRLMEEIDALIPSWPME